MLKLTIAGEEYFDEETSRFITVQETIIELEHSLFSLSKWESEFEKVFLNSKDLTEEESMGYIRAMVMTPDVSPDIVKELKPEQVTEIHDYISKKMTATTFGNSPAGQRRVISSELLYCWMSMAGIPYECQHWHLNRLLTLLRVFDAESNTKKSKIARGDQLSQRRALNEKRKAQLNTRG